MHTYHIYIHTYIKFIVGVTHKFQRAMAGPRALAAATITLALALGVFAAGSMGPPAEEQVGRERGAGLTFTP